MNRDRFALDPSRILPSKDSEGARAGQPYAPRPPGREPSSTGAIEVSKRAIVQAATLQARHDSLEFGFRVKLDFDAAATSAWHDAHAGSEPASEIVSQRTPVRIAPARRGRGLGASCARETLGLALRQLLRGDLLRERHARLVALDRQHGARVARAELAGFQPALPRGRKCQQAA